MLQWGNSGDGYDLASNLGKYELRKGDLFVLSWARVRRVRRGSIFLELPMCGGGVHSILLLPLVDRSLETIDVYIWRMFVYSSDCMEVCGNVCCVVAVAEEFVFNSVYVNLKYNEISLTFTAGSVCLGGVCSMWSSLVCL